MASTNLKVALLTYPNMLATSLSFPMELLRAAQQIAKVESRNNPNVDFVFCRLSDKPSSNLANIPLGKTQRLQDLNAIDLLILPAIWRNPAPTLQLTPEDRHAFLKLHQHGTTFAATGTGSWVLAECGLLDGKAATTHWFHLKQFKQRYPQLEVKEQHLITQAERIFCASSINSLADLTIHLISQFYSTAVANAVEQQFSPEARQHFRSRTFIEGADNQHGDELIAEVQQRLHDSYSQVINFKEIAEELKISQRTLNRRFLAATAISPNKYLLQLRISNAKELLKHSNLTIADIAIAVGFSSLSLFSTAFSKHQGHSPSDYRRSVKAKLFSSQANQ